MYLCGRKKGIEGFTAPMGITRGSAFYPFFYGFSPSIKSLGLSFSIVYNTSAFP